MIPLQIPDVNKYNPLAFSLPPPPGPPRRTRKSRYATLSDEVESIAPLRSKVEELEKKKYPAPPNEGEGVSGDLEDEDGGFAVAVGV